MSVRFRPERNKWEASFVVRGRRCRPLFDLKKDALEAEKKAKFQSFDLEEPIARVAIDDSFRMYFKEVSVGKTSKANDSIYLNLANHFFTQVRSLEFVDEINLQDLEALQKWLTGEQQLDENKVKKPWKASTVNRAFHTYDHFFTKMCAWEKLDKNPAQFLKSLSEDPVKRESLSLEMYTTVMSHPNTPEWFRDVMHFSRGLGARGSSIERFEWENVDLKNRILELKMKKGALAQMKLIRLPMLDDIFALLVRIRNKWPHIENGPVFRYDNGNPVRADVISKAGSRALKACGLVGVDLYGTRHGLANDLINAGVPIEIVRQLLGHASSKTTQNYTKDTSIETLSAALKLVRGQSTAPDATNEKLKTAVGSSDSE